MSKGVSPLIAAVLLIAATMSIAAILSYWASNFVRTALPEQNSSTVNCQFVDFQYNQCIYSNATQTLTFVLYNYRTVPITNIIATVFDVNGIPTWSNITLNGTLSPSIPTSYSLTGIPSNFTKLAVTTSMCPIIYHENVCTRV